MKIASRKWSTLDKNPHARRFNLRPREITYPELQSQIIFLPPKPHRTIANRRSLPPIVAPFKQQTLQTERYQVSRGLTNSPTP